MSINQQRLKAEKGAKRALERLVVTVLLQPDHHINGINRQDWVYAVSGRIAGAVCTNVQTLTTNVQILTTDVELIIYNLSYNGVTHQK